MTITWKEAFNEAGILPDPPNPLTWKPKNIVIGYDTKVEIVDEGGSQAHYRYMEYAQSAEEYRDSAVGQLEALGLGAK